MNLKEVLEKFGLHNCRVSVMLQPIRKNIYTFMRVKGKPIRTCCVFSEDRYPLRDNYKITVVPVNHDEFPTEHMYLADLESLIREGSAYLYVKNKRFNFQESL